MVTAPAISRHTYTLRDVAAEVAALPEIAAEWATDPQDARIVYTMEWEEQMDRLADVAAARARGELSPDEDAEYRRVVNTLGMHRDLAAHLDLPIPEAVLR